MTRLAISIGCPCGIGPEVAVRAAAEQRAGARVLLVGDHGVLERARKVCKVQASLVSVSSATEGFAVDDGIAVLQPSKSLSTSATRPGKPGAAAGAAQLAWIDAASDLVARGEADALVTGPVSKEVVAHSGAPGAAKFLGHTEHLAERLGAAEVVMAFASDALTTALVTTHLPLAAVPKAIDAAGVARASYWLARLVATLSASAGNEERSMRVAVASLNPHAGEGGLLGREEARAIVPGIARARKRLEQEGIRTVALEGPVPAETAFRKASSGVYAGVVAMYHDQATIPMKCLSFGEAVNVSLGLPIVRTSVDHGTGYDIAGQGVAHPHGMLAAIDLAVRLCEAAPRASSAATGVRPKSRSRTRRSSSRR